jgi:hypothetical protein
VVQFYLNSAMSDCPLECQQIRMSSKACLTVSGVSAISCQRVKIGIWLWRMGFGGHGASRLHPGNSQSTNISQTNECNYQ